MKYSTIKELRGFSPQTKFTNWAKLVPTLADKRVSRGQLNELPRLLISVF
jgi:hypothetical protein